jgi:DNA-binding MarR family transcriptional regulator
VKLTREQLERDFGQLWPTHVRALTRLLLRSREQLEGDLDQLLILCIIGDRAGEPRRLRKLSYDAFLDGDDRGEGLPRINVQSIAECTGIPRETVRRKVRRLEERGLIRRLPDRTLVPVQQVAARELSSISDESMAYIFALSQLLAELSESDPGPGAARPGRRSR